MGFLAFLILAVVAGLQWRRMDALRLTIDELRAEISARPTAISNTDAESATVAIPESEAPGAPLPSQAVEHPTVAPVPRHAEPGLTRERRLDFEDLFGRLLPIWAGGVTLAVAGFFLVRWSIDAGLLTPAVRVALAGLFGIALLAGSEAAYRWRDRVADPRVAQALAGAGLATLYAAFYLAGTAYGLIGSTLAFLGLAGVTGAAIALSFRFGLPSAVLGLVGGFAAPALVGSENANMPLLTLYLALVTSGLSFTGRRQGRPWLGLGALVGGLGWGALLLTGATPGAPDAYLLGVYLIVLGAVMPAFTGGEGRLHWIVRVGAAGLAAVQLAVLVQQGGFGVVEWGLYLMLGAALAWFGWREKAMREASAAAALVGIALLPFWPEPPATRFAAVVAMLAAIFAGVPLAQVWRGQGRAIDVAQICGVALGLGLAALGHFGAPLPDEPAPVIAVAMLALACLPAGAAAKIEKTGAVSMLWRVVSQGTAALLGFAALAQVLPHDALAWTAAAAAALVAWRARSLVGAIATLATLAAMWALFPLSQWLQAGALALVGTELNTADLPTLRAVALHIAPAVAGGVAWLFAASRTGARQLIAAVTVVVTVIALHSAFRHAFAALAGEDFLATGVIQRAAWETLLLGISWLGMARGWRFLGIALAGAALAHFAWFSLGLHNPLWSPQAVGSLPIVNALVPAFGTGFAVLMLLRRWLPVEPPISRWAIDAAAMLTIALFALAELRQAFSGTLLTATPVGQGEDLLRSLLGIVLAIGFLMWGARQSPSNAGERSWRIGSLVLMVIAVLKVFLVDAAGLAGLARIASFMALGFSLIGIGWFYTRQLRRPSAIRGE